MFCDAVSSVPGAWKTICSLKEEGRKARRLGVSDNCAGVTEEDLEWAELWRPRQEKLEI